MDRKELVDAIFSINDCTIFGGYVRDFVSGTDMDGDIDVLTSDVEGTWTIIDSLVKRFSVQLLPNPDDKNPSEYEYNVRRIRISVDDIQVDFVSGSRFTFGFHANDISANRLVLSPNHIGWCNENDYRDAHDRKIRVLGTPSSSRITKIYQLINAGWTFVYDSDEQAFLDATDAESQALLDTAGKDLSYPQSHDLSIYEKRNFPEDD